MDQTSGLVLNGLNDLGVAMPGGDHGDPGGKVQKAVSVGVFDDGAFAALGNKRIGARVGRRDNLLIPLDYGFGLGAGKRESG